MPRCRVDESIKRVVMNGFAFPLGVYPVEAMTPRAGYRADFEPADGGEENGQWEEWPDRYVFEIVISGERLEPLVRALLALMPGRVYPILDVLGRDAYREVDPYISYELIGMDRVLDALRRYRGYFFEDGLCGFGAMADEPFTYLFLDEHKIMTVRVEPHFKEKVEKVLAAFDLETVEDPAGADAAAHEHRAVLVTSDDRPDLLDEDELMELLRDEWALTLNVEGESNLDEEGNDLGLTPWHCIVRCHADQEQPPRYLEALLTARNLRQAEELGMQVVEELTPEDQDWEEIVVIGADRIDRETFAQWLKTVPKRADANPEEEGIIWSRWVE